MVIHKNEVREKKDNAYLLLRAKKVIAIPLSFFPPTAQGKHLTLCCPLLLILISRLQQKRTVYLYKSMSERSNLGKRASG